MTKSQQEHEVGSSMTVTVKGIEVKWCKVMLAKYKSFCDATGQPINPGDKIAFKHRDQVTEWLAERLWGRDKDGNLKRYHLQVLLVDVQLPTHKPNEYQQALFDTFFSCGDNIICPALAGCTKTSSEVWICKLAWEKGWTKVRKFLALAFNKTIEEELTVELRGTGVPARTTHSYGFSLLRRDNVVSKGCKPKNNTVIRNHFIAAICDFKEWEHNPASFKQARKTDHYRQMASAVIELAGYIKNWAILPKFQNGRYSFTAEQYQKIGDLFDQYGVTVMPPQTEKPEYICTKQDVVRFAASAVLRSIPSPGQLLTEIDFDDMLYLPLALDLEQEKFDCVLTDETQDFCAAQIEMIRRIMALGCRVVVVGDERQAIYGFRGADSKAWSNVTAMIKAAGKPFKVCMLPLNYRCDRIIIEGAQTKVPEIQGASKARGTWGEVSLEQALERANNDGVDVQLNDGVDGAPRILGGIDKPCTFAFIGRINSVLFATFYMLFKKGKRCHIKGYDHIGRPVLNLIQELCGDRDAPNFTNKVADECDVDGDCVNPGLLSRLDSYLKMQSERLEGEEYAAALEQCFQRVECIKVVIDNVKTDSVQDVVNEIKSMFEDNDDPTSIAICSGHRCKGLEWDVVFVLRPDLLPFPTAIEEEELQQEDNLIYVIWTRAKKRLYNVVTWPSKDDPVGKHALLTSYSYPDIEGYERYVPSGVVSEYKSEYKKQQAPLRHSASVASTDEKSLAIGTEPQMAPAEQSCAKPMPSRQSSVGDFIDDGKPFC